MNREGLLEREATAWRDLEAAFAAVPPDRRGFEGVVPGWSTHDLLWHCAYWAADAGESLERLRRGDPEPQEAIDDDALVADVLAEGRAMSWDEALARTELNRERVRAALSTFDDLPDEAVTLFTEETFEHYEEHAAEIRAFGQTHEQG